MRYTGTYYLCLKEKLFPVKYATTCEQLPERFPTLPEIIVYFMAGKSVLATSLLRTPILYFLEMSGFEPRELP
jgi:hypothetical protein